jgi:phosphate transport system ATP-binding protein
MEKLIVVEHLSLVYSDGVESLKDVSLDIIANSINVLFGPAGGGKSTLLRALNRLNDLADVTQLSGHIYFHGKDILD